MKYLGQHDDYSCGPIALLNMLRWRDDPACKSVLGSWRSFMRCTADRPGTKHSVINIICRFCGGTQVYRPTLDKMRKLLSDGQGLIVSQRGLRHRDGCAYGHAFFMDIATPKGFWCANLWANADSYIWVEEAKLRRQLAMAKSLTVFRFTRS